MTTTELTKVSFTWNHGGSHVLITGSFSNWSSIPMLLKKQNTWVTDLILPGNTNILYKFIVDGNYVFDPTKPTVEDSKGNVNNFLQTESAVTIVDIADLPVSIHQLQTKIAQTILGLLVEINDKAAQQLSIDQVIKKIEVSKATGYDFTFLTYQFASPFGFNKAADQLAALLVKKAKENKPLVFAKIDQGVEVREKPLVNFIVNKHIFASATIGEFMLPQKTHSLNQNIIVEFSSPNTNKPQHLGHVRNNCLGDAISRMLTYTGYNVHKINLINDRGVHICKSMLAYKKFGKGETPESAKMKGDHMVGDYYVKFDVELNKEYKSWLETPEAKQEFEKWKNSEGGKRIVAKNKQEREATNKSTPDDFDSYKSDQKDYYTNHFSALGKECNQMLVDWEKGNEEIRALWALMNSWVLEGFKETYKSFGIEHNTWEKESEVYEYGKSIVQDCVKRGVLEKLDDGCIACDLINIGVLKKNSNEKRKKVLLRANGTTVYMTQDMGVATTRWGKYNSPQRIIYVVASEQDRHFQILFKLMESLIPESKDHWYHLSYGMVLLPTGRMKSREGTVVDADDLLSELTAMAAAVTKEKDPSLKEDEVQKRAKKIALAAIKFYILAFNPPTTVTFDPENSLQFAGKSGPYLLYQYVRTRSILRKAGEDINNFAFDLSCLYTLGNDEERELLRALYLFPRDVQFAADNRDPSKVCDTIYSISQVFNAWYRMKDNNVVNCPDPVLKRARLQLVIASGNAIQRGLQLLGIETLEQM